MKKTKSFLFFLQLFAVSLFAQKATILDEKVYLESNDVLIYKFIDADNQIFTTKENKEFIKYGFRDNDTPEVLEDDYIVIEFPQQQIKVQTRDVNKVFAGLGNSHIKNMEKLLIWLMKSNVLNIYGEIDVVQLRLFGQKYNEIITK